MEVIARIPRANVLQPEAITAPTDARWATELTAAALRGLHAGDDDIAQRQQQAWLRSWEAGGWATDNADLGRPGVRWGADDVTGSLLATGSDNDENIYAKFRFPCHPVVHRAGLGLATLTRSSKAEALAALQCRGTTYRAMRNELFPLVASPSERPRGSLRERRSWDVADMLSRVLSRVTALELKRGELPACVVPLHERLAQCDARGENAKLVGIDPVGGDGEAGSEDVLLLATREIAAGEPITRDYLAAPQLAGDTSSGALRLLLQFGLPPKAWGVPWVDGSEAGDEGVVVRDDGEGEQSGKEA